MTTPPFRSEVLRRLDDHDARLATVEADLAHVRERLIAEVEAHDTDLAGLDGRVAALEQAPSVPDLTERVAALEAQTHGHAPEPPPPPPPLVDQIFPPGRQLLGAYSGGTRTADEGFANLIGHPPAIATTYHGLDTPQTILPNHAWRVAAGIVPLISLQSRTGAGVPIKWADVAAGAWDTAITANADRIAELDAPVLVAFGQEPKVWHRDHPNPTDTPADYAAATRRFVGILRARAPKAVYVCWMASADDDPAYHPGTEHVDINASDPYHWGHHPAGHTAHTTWAGECAEWERRHPGTPYFLAETGSDTTRSDSIAAAWWASAPDALAQLPNLRGLIFFNSRQWVINAGKPLSRAAYTDLADHLAPTPASLP